MQVSGLRKNRGSKQSALLFGFVFASIFGIYALYSTASAQFWGFASQLPISVTSGLVALPVNVSDSKGNFVRGLKQNDFEVYEDGQRQVISFFEDEDTPVSVGLLIDHSGSMLTKLPGVTSAITVLAEMSDPRDEVFVVDFNDFVSVEDDPGDLPMTDAARIQRAIRAIAADGQTALYDAIYEGLLRLRYARWQKRSLVIVSDGGDTASRHNFSEVLTLARESQVTIYSIGLLDDSGDEQNPKILKRLSSETGGLSFFPDSPSAVNNVALRIGGNLREQYTLAYVPQTRPREDTYHKIDVHVNNKGKLHVRTRMGFSVARKPIKSARSEERQP